MNTYFYSIELLSDAAPGSGETSEIHIDSEIPVDEYGLPKIPGKRVKGLLHESALEFQETMSVSSASELIDDLVEKTFGRIGDPQSESMRVSDAVPEDYTSLQQWLEWSKTNRENPVEVARHFTADRIRDLYTHIRTQTALEDGLVKTHSLRSLRLLNRGLVFIGTLDVPDVVESNFWFLHLIVNNVARMGIGRNRGLGRIRFELLDRDGDLLTDNHSLEDVLEWGGEA